MVGETRITVVGNLTADPELVHTQSGQTVANFTIASTARQYDKQAGEWKDGDTLFLRCSAWRDLAENIGQSLTKGTRVIAAGRLHQRTYENREGMKVTTTELEVDEIGPSLLRAVTAVHKVAQGDRRIQEHARPVRDAENRPSPSPYDQHLPYDDETPF